MIESLIGATIGLEILISCYIGHKIALNLIKHNREKKHYDKKIEFMETEKKLMEKRANKK